MSRPPGPKKHWILRGYGNAIRRSDTPPPPSNHAPLPHAGKRRYAIPRCPFPRFPVTKEPTDVHANRQRVAP